MATRLAVDSLFRPKAQSVSKGLMNWEVGWELMME